MAKKAGTDWGVFVLGASALFLFLRLSKETEKDKQNRAIQEELRAGITPPSLGARGYYVAFSEPEGRFYVQARSSAEAKRIQQHYKQQQKETGWPKRISVNAAPPQNSTPLRNYFGYDAAQQWAYDKAHGGTRWGPRSMGGGYDTFGARRTELAWYGKGKLYGWRIYREKGGLTIVPSRAGLRETTGHIAPSFKALPYARAPKAVRAAYDKLKRGGLT